jgi:general secretion pathway protein A
MQRAGTNFEAVHIFPPPTVAAIYNYSKGIPRLINTICENALIAAYARQSKTLTEKMIEEVAQDLRLHITSRFGVMEPGVSEGQQALAKSLLDLIKVVERAARSPIPHAPAPEPVSADLLGRTVA